MDTSHEMILTDPRYGVWECPSCPRQIVLIQDQFRVLDRGDFGVSHFGSTIPGLQMGPAKVMHDGQNPNTSPQ